MIERIKVLQHNIEMKLMQVEIEIRLIVMKPVIIYSKEVKDVKDHTL